MRVRIGPMLAYTVRRAECPVQASPTCPSLQPCNSEVYVVGRGFRGVSEEVLELLLAKCGEDVFASG